MTCKCRLASLGSPQQVAQFLFKSQLAPPGSGIDIELIQASSHADASGQDYYELEYRVRKESAGWRRHNLSVLSTRSDVLYTLNAQCSESRWQEYEGLYRRSAASFVLK